MTANGKALDRIDPAYAAAMPAPMGGALPTPLEWQGLVRMAETLADSNVIPYRLKGKPNDVAVILLAAREYGIPPLMALSKLPVVNGTPAPMGELMVALVLRAGHDIRVTVEGEGGPWEDMVAVCTTRRRGDTVDDVLRFTFREAVTAELVTLHQGKPQSRDSKNQPQPWELYTVNMLRWRAVANACRLRFPDVLLGMSYLPEELGAVVDAEGAPLDAEVVPPRGAPADGTLEQRTAQESADKLAEQPWPDHVLDAVAKAAADGGYLSASVTYGGATMTLEEAITAHHDARDHPDTVDAEVVEDPEEAPSAPQAAEEAPAEAPAPDQSPAAAYGEEIAAELARLEAATAAASAPAPVAEVEGLADALDIAREALACRDVETLQGFYRGAGELRALDVLSVVGDDDLAALDAPQDLEAMALGALLAAVGKYVTKHGAAVRDLGEPMPPAQGDGEDPWAADAAAGWPSTPAP